MVKEYWKTGRPCDPKYLTFHVQLALRPCSATVRREKRPKIPKRPTKTHKVTYHVHYPPVKQNKANQFFNRKLKMHTH